MRILIILFFVVAGFFSCKSQKDSTAFSNEFLLQIVNDPLFIAYQETIHQDAENVVLKIYDMEGIGEIFDALPHATNICTSQAAREKFYNVTGGKVYLENECKRLDLILKLDQKFNYSSFPEEVAVKVNRLYREINASQLEERAIDLYYQKN